MERKTFLKSVFGVVGGCFVPFMGKAVGELVEIPLETQRPMTYADWENMSWTRWCMRQRDYHHDEDIGRMILDLRAHQISPDDEYKMVTEGPFDRDKYEVVPDGTYDCEYSGYRHYPQGSELVKRKMNGIVIKNGQFVPEPTARTIEKLIFDVKQVPPPKINHRYIEKMEWNGNHFILLTGS